MRYKEFGKTGMKVSEMALGTWGIGGAGWDDNPEETRIDAICAAVENGVNFILCDRYEFVDFLATKWCQFY